MSYSPADGFPYYFDLVKNEDCRSLFTSISTITFLETIDDEKAEFRYAEGKWNIKQVLGHITDHERIKMHRAFLLSRKMDIELWGYDQNLLVDNSRFEELSWNHLKEDYANVRRASASFVDGLSEGQLKIKGSARQYEISLEQFLASIIGHEVHHLNIINEKYLK